MRKVILLILLLVASYSSELVINGTTVTVHDRPYIIRCIEGYKWVQFVQLFGRGVNYGPSGDPQQMFHTLDNKSLPVKCSI